MLSDTGTNSTGAIGALGTIDGLRSSASFHVSERFAVRYEAQFANLFSLADWGLPNMNITGKFGQITSSQSVAQAGPRTIQMALRFMF